MTVRWHDRSLQGTTAPLLAISLFILASLAFAAPASADMQSVYDPSGRLVGVIDPTNGSAQYNYDATGNILSIVRQPASTLTVLQFSPATGPVGTAITIYGTGFDNTADTTVNFNGVSASPTAVTSTQITVPVPSGATTGPISVSAPAGNLTTAASFTVTNPTSPTVTSFTPTTGLIGSGVTISGTNFTGSIETWPLINGRALAPVTSEATNSITGNVPAASSGHVSVRTPTGTATSTTDFIIPPPGYATSAVLSAARGTMGQPTTVNQPASGQVSLILFDGTAAERINVLLQLSALNSCSSVSVLAPDGSSVVASALACSKTWFTGPITLPMTGTYSIVFGTTGATNATVTATPFDVAPDVTQSVTIDGGASSLAITTPGQKASFTFSGTAGHRVGFLIDLSKFNWTSCGASTFTNPDGTILGTPSPCSNFGFYLSPTALSQTGTYTITISPSMSGNGSGITWGTGTIATTVFTVPADVTSTMSIGGAAASLTITAPTQQGSFTFTGSAGQEITALIDTSHFNNRSCPTAKIYNPDSTLLTSSYVCVGINFIGNRSILSQNGTYTIAILPAQDGNGSAMTWGTGTVTANVLAVPADATGSLTIGGGPASLTITTPSQHGSFTFSGTSGQQVSFLMDMSQLNWSGCSIATIQNPDGSYLASSYVCSKYNYLISPTTLSQTGTFTFGIVPSLGGAGSDTTWGTGTVAATVFAVPAPATNAITIGGSTQNIVIATPGQHGAFTFSGTSGQIVNLVLSFPTSTAFPNTISILNPDGTYLVNAGTSYSSSWGPSLSLTQTGTFTINIIPTISGSGAASTWGTGTYTGTLSVGS